MKLSEQECSSLLPWYLNNTLSVEERSAVEQELQTSEQLKQELDQLRLLRNALPSEPVEFPAAQLGWRRLQKQIRSEKQPVNQRNWGKIAAIAAMLVLTVQIGLFSVLKQQVPSDVRVLSGTPVVQAGEHIVQLQLANDASWQQVMELVTDLNGNIVQGPSALGIVHIRFAVEDVMINGESAADANAVIDWLKTQPAVQYVALEQ